MCTVSWAKRPNGYSLFFNRDESRERPEGLAPEQDALGNTHFICPRDPTGGGTWLLVNEYGLTLGLLNYYEAQVNYQPKKAQSRGKLPIQLAGSKNLAQVEAALFESDLAPYPPFHVLAVNRQASALLFTWDGQSKFVQHPGMKDLPISTSSFETAEVIESRRRLFRQTVLPQIDRDDALEHFHSSKAPAPDTHAVLMTRGQARTVSISQVKVEGAEASFIYRARTDDSDRLEQPITRSIDLK